MNPYTHRAMLVATVYADPGIEVGGTRHPGDVARARTIDNLPPTQQLALNEALHNDLVLRGSNGYTAEEGSTGNHHPIRTIRALIRADLMEEVGKRVQLTEQGRAVAEGRA